MPTSTFKFALRLLLVLFLVLLLHLAGLYFYNLPLFDHLLLAAYGLNGLMAILIFGTIDYLKHKNSNALGFLFMGGSLIKFAVFFLVFYPVYKTDGKMEGIEFMSFFVPYASCLIAETVSATKMLNKL